MRDVSKKVRVLQDLHHFGGILCHGCFDVLHVGHIRHFHHARQLSLHQPLIVTLTADRFITKGPGRPIFDQQTRAEIISALEAVDYVAIVHEPTGLSAIETIRPQYYVKGREYEGQLGVSQLEQDTVIRNGGRMFFTERWFSSTELVERLLHVCAERA